MKKLTVDLRGRTGAAYPIIIGSGITARICESVKKLSPGRVAVISDSKVARLYGTKLLKALARSGVSAEMFTFPAGEASKTRRTKERIEDAMLAKRFGRDTLVIALGGGVTGDLAGYTASTYMRGVPFIQVPTTLLAMVDSSIGGKTGVDTPAGKNLIGTFCQPEAVFIDTKVLSTLGRNEMLDGLIEMIKHGILADAGYYSFLDKNIGKIYAQDAQVLEKAITRSCEIKRDVVQKDEKESGPRKALNLGHTIGHALEQASNYGLSHGAAVGFGIMTETILSALLGLISPEESGRIIDTIGKAGITGKLPRASADKIIGYTRLDKKASANKVRYVLPEKVGRVRIGVEVPEQLVQKVLSGILLR